MRPSLLPIILAASLAPMCLAQAPDGTIELPYGSTGRIYSGDRCVTQDGWLTTPDSPDTPCSTFMVERNGCLISQGFRRNTLIVVPGAPHTVVGTPDELTMDIWLQVPGPEGDSYRDLVWFTSREQDGRSITYGPEWWLNPGVEDGPNYLQGDARSAGVIVTLELRITRDPEQA
ncbi:uncharacterized protein DSM5745_03653 [Aspergillus mulundensis]|uniref:Secreted protein n=1 Tax=Aspergillus mulundensis TaxID=1810919 RepID=A0A3D8SLF6_9EURO|nr:hypothetical protein DSM5745_03653 [Aspergillus mulundensis]RDW87011.1 hypothetical protein DSM5745_03653 [Aspergillus mulundensis]